MLRNKSQNTRLHALVSKLNLDEDQKKEFVFKYTNGRETSSSKMLVNECQALINDLQVIVNKLPKSPEEKRKNDQRRKMFSIAHELGWTKNGKVDVVRLENWVKKYGYKHHKKLNEYTLEELPKLVTQFEYVLKSNVHASK